ncbi:MAG: Ig-like domain-containing protein, partial [Planctomycetota bacterium]
HKDGLTADVCTRPKNICHIKYEDQKLTAELAELMVQLGARQLLYNGKEVQALVPMAQTVPKHDDHFHVVIDPNKVPKDLAPILLAETQSKTGGVLGEASFGKPRRSPKKKKKKRGKKGEAPATDPDPLPDARVAWRFLGDAKGFQKTVVVEAESKAAGLAYRSEPTKGPKTWHLIPGELADGQTLRWRVTVQCSDDTEQNIPWQELRVDLRPPVVAGVAPAPGSTSARRPKFTWTYKDPSAQLRAHVEIKHRKAKRGAAAAQLEGSAAELAAPVDLPKGDLSWRVVATDLAGNQAASDWVDFTVE